MTWLLPFEILTPQAPTHVLIVPNKVIRTANDLTAEDEQIAGRMLLVAKKVADQEGIAEDGYRLIINCNRHGGQGSVSSAFARDRWSTTGAYVNAQLINLR